MPAVTVAAPAGTPTPRWASAARDRVHRLARPVAPVVAVAALVTAALLFVLGGPPLLRWIPATDIARMHVDFDTFRASAYALLQHGPGSAAIYDTGARLHNLNPPLLSVLLAPLALLDPVTGYRLLTALSVLLVAGSVLLVCRELRLGRRWTTGALLVVLASSPLHGTLLLGQIYPLLLAGLTAGWVAERRGHPLLAAVCYGVTVALKPSLAPVLLLPAVQARRRPFLAGIAAATVATLVGVAVAGWPTAFQWLTMALAEPVGPTPDNASLPGQALRWGIPTVVGTLVGHGDRGRHARPPRAAHPPVRPRPGRGHRPGWDGAVRRARHRAAGGADRLAQLPAAAPARAAGARRVRPGGGHPPPGRRRDRVCRRRPGELVRPVGRRRLGDPARTGALHGGAPGDLVVPAAPGRRAGARRSRPHCGRAVPRTGLTVRAQGISRPRWSPCPRRPCPSSR